MGDAKHTETRDVPVAYLIKGADTSYLQCTCYLQWSPEVADCDRDLVTIVPLYAHSSERSALLKCEAALRGIIDSHSADEYSKAVIAGSAAIDQLDEARNGK